MALILCVDDDKTQLESLKRAAEKALRIIGGNVQTDVKTAESTERAKEILASGGIDVVVTDISFPSEGPAAGLEVISYARRLNPRSVVIAVTAYPNPKVEVEAMRRGAYDYVDRLLPGDVTEVVSKKIIEGWESPRQQLV